MCRRFQHSVLHLSHTRDAWRPDVVSKSVDILALCDTEVGLGTQQHVSRKQLIPW